MKKIIRFIDEHDTAILTIVILVAIFWFVHSKLDYVERNGVITVAKALRFESAESGSDLYIEIYLNGKQYEAAVAPECQYYCIGNYFFVKVNKDDPADYPVFYGHNPVPSCIMEKVKLFTGWKTFPNCNNLISPRNK